MEKFIFSRKTSFFPRNPPAAPKIYPNKPSPIPDLIRSYRVGFAHRVNAKLRRPCKHIESSKTETANLPKFSTQKTIANLILKSQILKPPTTDLSPKSKPCKTQNLPTKNQQPQFIADRFKSSNEKLLPMSCLPLIIHHFTSPPGK
jgi:hypothetical protein